MNQSAAYFKEKKKSPWGRKVPSTDELKRILSVPRREWSKEDAQSLADQMTELLKLPDGQQSLRPVQAVSLHDLAQYGGLVCLARVGAGKSLISLLAPYVAESYRPLLIIPANLMEKTKNDLRLYRQHWEIPGNIQIKSYEALAREKQAHYLELTKPDLIICDEAHHLKNTRAAVTRRKKRYLKGHPDTKLAFLSGTLTNRSLKDYWHLLRWAMPEELVPMPREFGELEMWSLALDEKVPPGQRVRPGALELLHSEEEKKLAESEPLVAARRAYGRRLVETPAVVSTKETFDGSALYIHPHPLKPPKRVEEAFTRLRDNWETPDGQPISDGHIAAKHAKELALGFYYKWDPYPPEEWLTARRNWCSFVRKVLAKNKRNLDTEQQVVTAVLEGIYRKDEYVAWMNIKDTFEINVKSVWIDDFAVDAAIAWAKKHRGIVWVFHTAFGKKLAEKSGMLYYGEGGFSADGRFIQDHPANIPLIASLTANKEGKNLQKWSQNLVVHPPSSGKWWEQLIGRTHRDGQEAKEVHFHIFGSCIEHYQAFYKAVGDAIYVQDSMPQVQKLLFAESSMPSLEDIEKLDGDLWHGNQIKKEE